MARILLVEDETDLRAMMRDLLAQDDHFVSEAENGRAGIARLAREQFDLVITDILMPESDGLEVIQAARRLRPGTRILAISGSSRNPAGFYLAMAAKIGAHKTLVKPFPPAELLATVSELLDKAGS
jgi:DNA-binding response OmpR family regulator